MTSPRSPRVPQLAFRLGSAQPDPAARWRDGATIDFLGRPLHLHLGTDGTSARQENGILHLPLPPQASARQIQDSAEAWLRAQGLRFLNELIAQESALAGRRAPELLLSFAAKGDWIAVANAATLRCNWRLIEQSPETIALVVKRALAQMATLNQPHADSDLFGAQAA